MNSKGILSPNKTMVYKINEKKKMDILLGAFFDSISITSDTLILQSIDEVHSVVPRSQYSYFY